MVSKSKSRKVNGFVKAYRKWEKVAKSLRAAERAERDAAVDMVERRNTLTGGQLAEAERMLRGGEA